GTPLVNTRPDISASVSILAKKSCKPKQEDWNELKRVLKYLKGTANLKLAISKHNFNGQSLYGFSDANWAEDRNDRKSNSGHVFLVNGGTDCWSSRKQSLTALSTCEAEFVALSEACRAASWIRRVLISLKQNIPNETTIYEDNQSCLDLVAEEQRLSDQSKHIDTRFHFVKDYIS
ncbi:secreted RxLR effector protein 161-like, partial [Contarinia nasturtii]|uniref:secreted RxLR effector protein 161-like n=1 Tax=Contarinia nasturtii TaxID=265458 RepID=UPI0012D3C6A4